MPAPAQPTEGTAQVQYQLALPRQKYLNFDQEKIAFVEATIQDSVLGQHQAEHLFRSGDPALLSALKNAMAGANPVLLFRLGFGGDVPLWLPWQRHLITDYFSRAQGIGTNAGHVLVIKTEGELTRMSRGSKVVARKGTISGIVQSIAQSTGLEAVVEPTDGEFVLIQSFLDDTQFIRERLLDRAINKQGKGGYFFFIRDNVLHFHTLDYQGSVKHVDYYADFSGNFDAMDRSQNPVLWHAGITGVCVVLHDPYTGQSKEVDSDPAKAVRLADSIYQFDAVEGGNVTVPYHLSTNPVVEANAIAQARYQRARLATFKTELTLFKSILIRHGDLLNLNLDQQNNRTSEYSGYHYVVSTTHAIKQGKVTSVYTLNRGETQTKRGVLSTQDKNLQLVPETKAPGVTPNIVELQSSAKTKGAGNETSATTFAAVTDAQTGLVAAR
jgi:hypothetical protein